jgi:phosphatidylglycerophosphate synthase
MTDTLIIPFWRSCPSPDLRLLGVEFEDRIVLQSRQSGFKKFLLQPGPDEIEQLPEQFLVLFPNLLLSDGAWKRLNTLELASDAMTMARETDSLALICCKNAGFVAGAFRESDSYSGLLAKLRARLKCEFVDFGEREWVAFRNELDRPHVENWLLRRLIKDSEGLMSRHLERRISLAVTRNLVDTRITPNVMTLISVGIGLTGAFFFALPQRSYPVVGALLFWLHSVLDGCDGELARLKFAESRWGGLLDFWGDNVVHSAVFSAIAVRIYVERPGTTPLGLAALAAGGTLLSASLVYWTTMRRKRSGGPLFTSVVGALSPKSNIPSPAEKMADQLARRDFIYLVVALALLGKVNWFLWMGAVGAPLYFLALAAFSLKNSPAARQQNVSPEISK